jgi:hypothetical protein
MAGSIDPGFQGAPVLQDEFNPTQFVQNLKNQKNEVQKEQYQQKGRETAEGLKNLSVDLKGWEDKSGFNELMQRNQKAQDMFLSLSNKGLNLVNPKTNEEVLAYKALTDHHEQTKQLADQWNQQKGLYDKIQEALVKDNELPEGEQRIDHEATQKNLEELLSKHTIGDRAGLLQKAIVQRPQIADVNKFISSIKDRAPKLDIESHPITDSNGNIHNVTTEVQDDKKAKEIEKYYRDQYRYADPATKAYIHEQGKLNKANEPAGWDDSDRFVAMAYPNYKQKFMDKQVGKGGGLNIDVGGQHVELNNPGKRNTFDLTLGDKTYKDHVDFGQKNTIKVNLGDLGVSKVIRGKREVDVSGKNDTPAEILHYLPKEHSFVFRAKGPSMGAGVFDKDTFIVPEDHLDPDMMNLKVTVDGKETTLKDIVAKEPKIKTIGGFDFNKYPKNGRTE